MKKKVAHATMAVLFGLSIFSFSLISAAQTTPAKPATPTTGTATTSPAGAAETPNAPSAAQKFTGTKIGTLAVEQAVAASNEGQRDLGELSKKFEPKQSELKSLNDEIDALKKQLNTQQDKLNDESREKLVHQIEAKQKSFDRDAEEAKEDFQNQAGEIENRILTKMVPIIQKYVTDNGYGLLLDTDTAQTWPRGAVILSGPSMDITQQIVEAYNVQSGVAAPAPGTPAKPAAKTPAKPSTPPKQ
jgi:outer membrane protein